MLLFIQLHPRTSAFIITIPVETCPAPAYISCSCQTKLSNRIGVLKVLCGGCSSTSPTHQLQKRCEKHSHFFNLKKTTFVIRLQGYFRAEVTDDIYFRITQKRTERIMQNIARGSLSGDIQSLNCNNIQQNALLSKYVRHVRSTIVKH